MIIYLSWKQKSFSCFLRLEGKHFLLLSSRYQTFDADHFSCHLFSRCDIWAKQMFKKVNVHTFCSSSLKPGFITIIHPSTPSFFYLNHLILHLELHCSSFAMWGAEVLIEWLSPVHYFIVIRYNSLGLKNITLFWAFLHLVLQNEIHLREWC